MRPYKIIAPFLALYASFAAGCSATEIRPPERQDYIPDKVITEEYGILTIDSIIEDKYGQPYLIRYFRDEQPCRIEVEDKDRNGRIESGDDTISIHAPYEATFHVLELSESACNDITQQLNYHPGVPRITETRDINDLREEDSNPERVFLRLLQ